MGARSSNWRARLNETSALPETSVFDEKSAAPETSFFDEKSVAPETSVFDEKSAAPETSAGSTFTTLPMLERPIQISAIGGHPF